MKLLLIFNPHAAHGRAGKLIEPVRKRFAERGVETELMVTGYPGHAAEIVRDADFTRVDGLAAAGGDGTLFETVNGYFQNRSGRRIPMGIIPVGTGNAFARDLDLKTMGWEKAVDVIAAGKTRPLDAGLYRCGDSETRWLNIIGLGFVADVVQTASRLKWIGNLSYTLGVFHRMAALKTFRMTLTADGKTLERESLFVEVSNTRYTSNFLMAPAARLDDGLLDVTILGPMTRRRLIAAFPKIFTGEHVHLPEVESFTASHIQIETDPPKALTPDGELTGSTPVTIECLPKAVEAFVP
jgi:diacylglycerol kinase (ATP)